MIRKQFLPVYILVEVLPLISAILSVFILRCSSPQLCICLPASVYIRTHVHLFARNPMYLKTSEFPVFPCFFFKLAFLLPQNAMEYICLAARLLFSSFSPVHPFLFFVSLLVDRPSHRDGWQ